MSDRPPIKRTPLVPEEFRSAMRWDHLLLAFSLLLASALSTPIVRGIWTSLSTGGSKEWLAAAVFWNALVWLVPVLRVLFHWRAGVLGGVDDRSYVVRTFWQTQLLLVGIVMALVMPVLILIWAVCGPIF